MRYEREQHERWLAWFTNPRTTSEEQIRAGLESVPVDQATWDFVEGQVRAAIAEAHAALSAAVVTDEPENQPADQQGSSARVAEEVVEQLRLLDLKEQLVNEEVEQRRLGGPRAAAGNTGPAS
jgi:hypothetical protein